MDVNKENTEERSVNAVKKAAQRVLLVDGNPKQRDAYARLLAGRLRYAVDEVGSGAEAVRMLSGGTRQADLILLDISTVADGFTSLVALKEAGVDAPVVVLVKYADYQGAAEALLLGAQDFLTKPVAEERMEVTLRNAMQFSDMKRACQRSRLGELMPDEVSSAVSDALISLVGSDGNARRIEDIEQAAIRFAIRFYNGHMTEVARRLGIGRSTLYRKLEGFGEMA